MQQPRWQDSVIAAGVYEDVRFVLLADEATPEQESLAHQAAACLHVSVPDIFRCARTCGEPDRTS